MARVEDEILLQLKDIALYVSDINAIRNGEYDPPRGAESRTSRRGGVIPQPDDIYKVLTNIAALLERQNEMLYHVGVAVTGDERTWRKAIREN